MSSRRPFSSLPLDTMPLEASPLDGLAPERPAPPPAMAEPPAEAPADRTGSRPAPAPAPRPAPSPAAGRPERRKGILAGMGQVEDSPSFYLSLSDLMSLLLVFFVLVFSLTAPLAGRADDPQQTRPAAAPPAATTEKAAPAGQDRPDPWGLPEPLPRPVTRSILALTAQGEPDPGLVAAPGVDPAFIPAQDPNQPPAPGGGATARARNQTLLHLVTASRPVAAASLPSAGSRLSELVELVDRELGGRRGLAVEPTDGGGVLVRLDEAITFDQGRARLKPAMAGPLGRLAAVLARRPESRVVVTGHTDDVPINTPRFASNWELSAARAAAVARALMGRGADRSRFTIRGLADTHPRAANDTPAHRELNRRVEIELRPAG